MICLGELSEWMTRFYASGGEGSFFWRAGSGSCGLGLRRAGCTPEFPPDEIPDPCIKEADRKLIIKIGPFWIYRFSNRVEAPCLKLRETCVRLFGRCIIIRAVWSRLWGNRIQRHIGLIRPLPPEICKFCGPPDFPESGIS